MEDRSKKLRHFFASLICAGKDRDPRIEQAFASVKRVRFAGKNQAGVLARLWATISATTAPITNAPPISARDEGIS
jgi:hypothetical protein